MNIDDLFPNSPTKLLNIIGYGVLSDEQRAALEALRAQVEEMQRHQSPVCVYVEPIYTDDGAAYLVVIQRGENRKIAATSRQMNRAYFIMREWKHILLGHEAPTPE